MKRRRALVIGADAYPGHLLHNAVSDAGRLEAALTARGFVVQKLLDPTQTTIDLALASFRKEVAGADLALIYLAGHAVERHGTGYFLPVDFPFPLTAGALRYAGVPLNHFVDATKHAAARIVVLDACRNWPGDDANGLRLSNDLDEIMSEQRNWPNLLLAYATSATTGADDGAPGEGSPFAQALARHLLDHRLTVDECFRKVGQDVLSRRHRQQPWTYSSLAGTISFSDLPRFQPIQRHALPNNGKLGSASWLTTRGKNRSLACGVGDGLAWQVDLGGFRSVESGTRKSIVGAAQAWGMLMLASYDGAIHHAGLEGNAIHPPGKRLAFGLVTLPDGRHLIHHGAGFATCLRIVAEDKLEVVRRFRPSFDVYCCTAMPDGPVWLAGGQGSIVEVDPLKVGSRTRSITHLGQHVNRMAVTRDGSRVFVVGQHGTALELTRAGKRVRDILPGRKLRTAAGIREALLNLADDDLIHRIIFEPKQLPVGTRIRLQRHLERPPYDVCAIAPSLPILAIGTSESTILIVDIRDMQLVQELDVGSGAANTVSNVAFLSDRELVACDGRGRITFFGS